MSELDSEDVAIEANELQNYLDDMSKLHIVAKSEENKGALVFFENEEFLLALVEAFRIVCRQSLFLLGIDAIEEM